MIPGRIRSVVARRQEVLPVHKGEQYGALRREQRQQQQEAYAHLRCCVEDQCLPLQQCDTK